MFAATHNKLKKAADGIGTQVATCMINKLMAKINGKEVYNIRGPQVMEKRKEIEERRSQFLSPLKEIYNVTSVEQGGPKRNI